MFIPPRSIKGRIFLWFFVFSSVLLITFGVFIYYKAEFVIFNAVNRTLHSKIQLITGTIHEEKDGKIELELVGVSGDYSIPRSGHYYKVLMNGQVLEASKSLINEDFDLASGTFEAYDENSKDRFYLSKGPAGEPIKILQHDLEFKGLPMSVFVAESLAESLRMILLFRRSLLIAIPITVFMMGIIGYWVTRKSLKPLEVFSSRVSHITYKNLNERVASEKQVLELNRLENAFNEMLDRLQKAFETESRLISDASHELKTPLSVIRSHCDILLQKERTTAEYVETLSTIKEVSANMANLVNDMLSLARLESGLLASVNFESISLSEMLGSVIDMTRVLADRKHIKIKTSFEGDIIVSGDKSRLSEALLNLVENAFTYTREGGSVDIAAVIDKENRAVISIKDTGPGIKKEDLDKIFERFYRADASRSIEGTGLGLSITKAVIEAHSGRIAAESEVGKGTCFTVTLPLASGQA